MLRDYKIQQNIIEFLLEQQEHRKESRFLKTVTHVLYSLCWFAFPPCDLYK